MGAARLSLSLFGDRLVAAVGAETLSNKSTVPWDAARALELSARVVEVLARGNRERKHGPACVADLRALGEELWRLLPAPTRADLDAHTGDLLLVELDEALVAVPWELLHDGDQFLCRRFELGRAVTTSVPQRAPAARRMGTPARMLVVCADTVGNLPYVTAEGAAIVAQLESHPGISVRMATDRPVEHVRKVLKDFDIVHFAGHADHDRADPDGSGWHLRGGKLTARDVAALAPGRPMPLVVFSNSCQSSHESGAGGGDPGRVFGLANAFLHAGVKYYLGTQWEVVDAHSQWFARSFYAEVARGRSIGAAVRRAREAVIVQEGESGLAWAAYVLYGDPAFIPLGDRAETVKPRLPTPADIVTRDSIKGVVRMRSGEWTEVRGGPGSVAASAALRAAGVKADGDVVEVRGVAVATAHVSSRPVTTANRRRLQTLLLGVLLVGAALVTALVTR